MRPAVFADSGAWVAIVNDKDRHHAAAASQAAALASSGTRILTSNYVVDETATRLRYDIGLGPALAFRGLLREGIGGGSIRVAWVDARVEDEAWGLLEQRPELKLSFTDATSAVISRRAKVSQVFGFDADFRALGFDLVPGA